MAEKGIRTNSYWQTINQLNKKQTAPDGGEGELNKKQTAPDGREGDKDQLIPTFPTGKLSINLIKNKQYLMAEKGIRTNSHSDIPTGKLSINLIKKTAPDGREGDKDQLIPTFPNGNHQSIK